MHTVQQLKENVAIMLPENGLAQKLAAAKANNRKLVIKLGFDPTAPDLHLGHAVVLKKVKQFQQLGHDIVIVVGSFTARIGDPTGKNKSRKPLTVEEVQHHAATYIDQLSKVIDITRARIVFNSDWLDQLSFSEVIQILSNVTVAQLMHRNDFNNRFVNNSPIAMHELVYPILQGFDSVQIEADIEMGGTDQLFNCTMGRQLQEAYDKPSQIVLCMPLLKGLDGEQKMSKSLNNTIGLTDAPNDMFGKTMSIPDSLIPEWLDLTTDFSTSEKEAIQARLANGENPMNIKKLIAKNIIQQYHNEADAEAAEQFFSNQFQRRDFDEKVFTPIAIQSLVMEQQELLLLDLCHQLKQQDSRSALRRLIEAGGVQVNNEKVLQPQQAIVIKPGARIKIGKKDFYELM